MSLVNEFITSTKDLKLNDAVVENDPAGAGLKASFPNVAVQPDANSDKTYEVAGFGLNETDAVSDLNEKLKTAVERGQLVKVEAAPIPKGLH